MTPCSRQIRCDQRGDRALVGQVQAVERLVEQQQPGLADQRLGDQQPLLLAAGERADRPAARSRSRRRARSPRRPARRGSPPERDGSGRPQRAPSRPSRTRSMPRIRVAGVEAAALRQVADLPLGRARAARRAPRPRPRLSGSSAEQHLSSVDLPDAVRARARRRTRPADLEVHVAPDDRVHRAAPARPRRAPRRRASRRDAGDPRIGGRSLRRRSSAQSPGAERLLDAPQLRDLPCWKVAYGRRERLGDRRDRDVRGARELR